MKAGGVHAVAYRIGAYNSEGMKSENPHAGVYKTDTARDYKQPQAVILIRDGRTDID